MEWWESDCPDNDILLPIRMSRSGGDRNCVKLYGSIRYDNARTQNINVLRHVFPNRSKEQLLGRQLTIWVHKTQHTGSKKMKVKNYRAITQLENAFLVLYMGSYWSQVRYILLSTSTFSKITFKNSFRHTFIFMKIWLI